MMFKTLLSLAFFLCAATSWANPGAFMAIVGGGPVSPAADSVLSVVAVATAATDELGATSITVSQPAGTLSGHLMLAYITAEENDTTSMTSVPTGWTQVWASAITADYHAGFFYYKQAGGSEPANYTWEHNERELIGIIITIASTSGSPSVGNYDVSTSNTAATSAVAPSISVQKAGNIVIMTASSMYGTTWTQPAGASPTWSEQADLRTSTGSGNMSSSLHTATFTSTGATGDITAEAVNSDKFKAALIEIQRP